VHLGKRPFEILDHVGEAPLYRAFPRDQYIIIACDCASWARDPDRLFQPPPRPVAQNRIAERLGGGKAEAGGIAPFRRAIPRSRLEHQRGRRVASATPDMQELRSGLEASDRRHLG